MTGWGVSDGDAKVWGTVADVRDEALHRRFAQAVYEEIGLDIRGEPFEHCYRAEFVGAAAVTLLDGHLDITTWREGHPETVVRKH